MKLVYNDLSILIPTINEAANLRKLLPELKNRYPGASLFVLDDGSTDETYGYIEELISGNSSENFSSTPLYFLSRDKNTILTNNPDFKESDFKEDKLKLRRTAGLTASVLDGLALVSTDNFAVIDADFQHPPELVNKMYFKLNNNELVTAYRAKLEGFPLHRKLLTNAGTFISRSALARHNRVKDPLSGAFAGKTEYIRRHIFNTSTFKPEGFKILFDLLKILPESVRVDEVGYEFNMRSRGESKIGWKQLWSFFKSVFTPGTTKFYTGLLLFGFILAAGLILVLIYGDVAISNSFRAAADANPGLRNFFKIITGYGNPLYWAIFIFFLIYGKIKNKKRLFRVAVIYIAVQIIASVIITNVLLKPIVGRPRPGYAPKVDYKLRHFTASSKYKSFPSGHTTDAFSSAGVMWGFLSSYSLSFLTFGFSLLIGISRIFVGSHYPLDVLGGMAVGFLTGLILTFKKL
ncbi:MAG: phosphatase PAP2 family protein [Elusimicrobiota bacterium]|nr:phosphatase PAP2 family protein [Elusimicrobiota bacterium]